MKKIIVFDFDKTLFFTPEPNEGRKTFLQKTGIDWPYSGWWGRKETLDLNVFNIPINDYVYNEYKKHRADSNNIVILATGRITKLKSEVESVLKQYDLEFNSIYLNPGMDTYDFKSKLFENYISRHNPVRFIMYDDRHEHIVKFYNWAKEQKCEVEINDVVNKNIKIFNN